MRPASFIATAAAVAVLAGAAVVATDEAGLSATAISADYPDMNNYDPPDDTHYVRHQ